MKYIGVVDKNEPLVSYNVGFPEKYPAPSMQKFADGNDQLLIAETSKYRVFQVRWPVFNRVSGEGLLLEPKSKPVGTVIAVPDADQQPEQLVGLADGVPAASQFARHLAENGYQVLVPVIISRTLVFPDRDKQQTYREWLYRQSFQMGRHIIGYEVQKIMSAIDWFRQNNSQEKIGIAGYNEGGLLAFYAAAVDKRIDVVMVSGYFNSRQKVWDEPLYRNVWAILTEFGDAEIASLVAPRPMVIEYSAVSTIIDELSEAAKKDMQVEGFGYTGYKGKIETPDFKQVQSEFDRIDILTNGTAAILDYKTGATPSPRQVTQLLSPQLPLEAAMLAQDGFNIGKFIAEELIYLSLASEDKARQPLPIEDGVALAQRAVQELQRRITWFNDPATPYRPRVRPFRADIAGDYDHLARVREWSPTGWTEEA